MARHALFAGLAIALILFSTSASAEYEPKACRSGFFSDSQTDDEFFAALAALDKCQRDFLGIIPIEQRRSVGEEVVRAYVRRGERSLPVFVEYVREPRGRAWLSVKILEESKPSVTVVLADSDFSKVQARWIARARFEASWKTEYEARKAEEDKQGVESVCIGYEGAAVESVHANSTERVDLDGCKPWEFAFVDFLFAEALNDTGRCAQRFRSGRDDERLVSCVFAAGHRR